MANRELSAGDGSLMARMMDLDLEGPSLWDARDLEAVLEHQLAAPLETDLAGARPGFAGWLAGLNAALRPPVATFADLFSHPAPPVELLELVKDFAKRRRSDPDGPLPEDIATVLYLAAIAAALVRRGARITRLSGDGLRHGLEWSLRQPWLDPRLRDLFERAREASGS